LIYDAIVIGGGFAGVTAARELGLGGRKVLLLEARNRLGGRTWYKENALEGLSLEMGGMFVDRRQKHVWAEIERYGLATTEPEMPGNFAWLQNGRLRRERFPVPHGEAEDLERAIRTWVEASKRVEPRGSLCGQEVEDLDVPMPELFGSLRLGPYTLDLLAAFFGEHASAPWEEASALNFIHPLATANNSIAAFVLASTLSPNIEEGTGALIAAMVVDSGAEIRLSEPVRRVDQREQGTVRVRTDSGEYVAGVVVVAVPPNVWKDIEFLPVLAEGKRRVSTEEHAGKGSKVWAIVRGAPEDFFALGPGPGLDLVASEGTAGGGVLMVGFGPDADAFDAENKAEVQQAFRAFLPDCEVLASTGHNWKRDPYARGTWTVFRPGQLVRHEKTLHEREGRLVFCGTDTGVLWSGYIDGAIEGGLRAGAEAGNLLGDMGYPRSPSGQRPTWGTAGNVTRR